MNVILFFFFSIIPRSYYIIVLWKVGVNCRGVLMYIWCMYICAWRIEVEKKKIVQSANKRVHESKRMMKASTNIYISLSWKHFFHIHQCTICIYILHVHIIYTILYIYVLPMTLVIGDSNYHDDKIEYLSLVYEYTIW